MFLEVLETADNVDQVLYKMLKFRVMCSPECRLEGFEHVAEYMKKDLKASKELSEELTLTLPVRDCMMNHCLDTFDAEDV
jgi:hypothetical protein